MHQTNEQKGTADLRTEGPMMRKKKTTTKIDELRAHYATDTSEELSAAIDDNVAVWETEALDECVEAWRITARQLDDPLRRRVLTGEHQPSDFVEAEPPGGRRAKLTRPDDEKEEDNDKN